MSDLKDYTNDELHLIYKNQNCSEDSQNCECESYDEEGRYTVYVQSYSEGCFITSAVCRTFEKPDDCKELMAFREFRDTYMQDKEELKKEIEKYYEIAPKICKAIDDKGEVAAKQEYVRIWDDHLSKAFDALNNKELEKTYNIYKNMVKSLEKTYLN